MLTTIASFRSNQELRRIGMVASVVWIVHNILVASAAIVLEVFFLGRNLVGYYRYFLRKGDEVVG